MFQMGHSELVDMSEIFGHKMGTIIILTHNTSVVKINSSSKPTALHSSNRACKEECWMEASHLPTWWFVGQMGSDTPAELELWEPLGSFSSDCLVD